MLLIGLGAGCDEDDEPTASGGTVSVPADAASLNAAVEMVGANGRIVLAPGTYRLPEPVVIPAGLPGLRIVAEDPDERPVLQFTIGGARDAIVIEASGVEIEAVRITGSYRNGVTFAEGGALLDSEIRNAGNHAVHCEGAASRPYVARNVIADAAVFGVACADGAAPILELNTIVGAGDCGIYSSGSRPVAQRNIVAESANFGIACFGSAIPDLGCNVLFDSQTAHYSNGCTPGADDVVADPRFCDASTFALWSDSPCLPENAGACMSIGASRDVCEFRE